MRLILLLVTGLLASPATAAELCVTNATSESWVFVAEVRDGTRIIETRGPGERLCAPDPDAVGGTVGVFESTDSLEGCSRLVPPDAGEALIRYVDFDRCEWASHSR
jgi:hypothetical protein